MRIVTSKISLMAARDTLPPDAEGAYLLDGNYYHFDEVDSYYDHQVATLELATVHKLEWLYSRNNPKGEFVQFTTEWPEDTPAMVRFAKTLMVTAPKKNLDKARIEGVLREHGMQKTVSWNEPNINDIAILLTRGISFRCTFLTPEETVEFDRIIQKARDGIKELCATDPKAKKLLETLDQ
jgi:hypothetical protein